MFLCFRLGGYYIVALSTQIGFLARCYKAEMETAIRTRGMAGFQLLDLQDFPGQGTALVGILDAFMDSKNVISAEKWRQSCNDVVLPAVDQYRNMIKAQPKQKLDLSIQTEYPALQTSVYHSKKINAIFGPLFSELTRQLLDSIDSRDRKSVV